MQYATYFVVANSLALSTIYYSDSYRQQAYFVNEEVNMKALKRKLLWFYVKANALQKKTFIFSIDSAWIIKMDNFFGLSGISFHKK